MSKKFIIENVQHWERERICDNSEADDIVWYPDNLLEIDNVNIVVEGTKEEVNKLLKIMGR